MKNRKVPQKSTVLLTLFLAFCSVIFIYPLFYLIFYSLKTNNEIFLTNPFGFPNEIQWVNYANAISAFDIIAFFRNSIIVSAVSIVGILICALPFAYASTRMVWRGKMLATNYIAMGMFIPIQVIIIPLSILVRDMHLSNTYFALIIPYVAFNLAFSSMILSASFAGLPKEMEESAFIDGAGIGRTFLEIIVPLVKPAVATTVIFGFLNVWNEYTVASILISKNSVKTLPIGLANFVGQHSTDWGAMGACLVMASIPTIVIYLIFSEQVERALTIGGAVKG